MTMANGENWLEFSQLVVPIAITLHKRFDRYIQPTSCLAIGLLCRVELFTQIGLPLLGLAQVVHAHALRGVRHRGCSWSVLGVTRGLGGRFTAHATAS